MADVKELLSKIEDENLRKQAVEAYEAEAEANAGSTLRKQLEEALNENKQFKTENRHHTYAEAGLPEGAFDVFDQLYDGELTVEGLQGFAKEKGFALPDGETPSGDGDGGQPAGEGQPTPQGPSGDERLQQAGAGALPARDLSDQDKSAQALSEGDTTAAIKHQLAAMHKAQ